MKPIVRPSFFAFFLTPASASASTHESSLRPAPGPVRWASGSSIPVAAESATHGRRGSGPRILSRSDGRPAPTSTGRSRSPEVAALAEAAFDSPQIFLAQSRFPSRSSGPLQPPQSAFLQLLRPATDGLSMSTDAASNFRLVYALPQQFGCLTAALFQPYEVPANSCWISHAETVAQKIRNVTILCDPQ